MVEIRRFDKRLGFDCEFLESLYEESKDSDFFRRMPKDWNTEELENIEQNTNGVCYLLIVDNEFAGLLSVTNADFYYGFSADLGLVLLKKFRDFKVNGFKVAFTAMVLLCKHLFSTTRFNKLRIRILSHRDDLYNSFIKGGFEQEGYLKENIYYHGKFHDEIDMVLFRSKFEEMYGKIE